jgi:hypothetical protein
MQRSLVVTGSLVLAIALALWVWLPGHESVDTVGDKASPKQGLQSAGLPASLDAGTPANPAAAPSVQSLTSPSATTGSGVPVTVTAPQQLLVGEMNDLVVGVGANADVAEISFTVQFDANVLQVRAGTEGDWAMEAGLKTRFAAEISGKEDRVQIRASVSGQRAGLGAGSVGIVKFQAVAPGTTSVMISDVVAKDWVGRWIPVAVSASNLRVTVDSVPPSEPEPWRQHRAVSAEPVTETAQDGD